MQDNHHVKTPPSHSVRSAKDEVDIVELWRIVWSGRWMIAGITLLFVITAVITTLFMPNIYKSEVLLAPVTSERQGGLAGVAGQLGGLAGLAGIDIGSGGVDKTALALEILQSRAFITQFVRNHNIEVPLVAAKKWDMSRNEWVFDRDIYDDSKEKWVEGAAFKGKRGPSDWQLYNKFSDVLVVKQDKATGLVRVGIKLESPEVAKVWVDWLIADLNSYMRDSDIQEAKRSINYLQEQLSKTSVAEMQNIFYQLIEEQTKKIMLAEVRDQYVFKVIDPAVVPEGKFEPRRILICLLAALAGLFVSLVVAFLRASVR